MSLQRRASLGWTCAGALLAAAGTVQAAPIRVDVRAGALQNALNELAQENRVDILYAADLVRGRRSQGLKGRFTPEHAIEHLLAGSGIGYRITPDGVFILFERRTGQAADRDDGAIAEVLILGRRTQNADIRRTENDIQPYKVAGPRDLEIAPQDNIEQYLRDRLPANGQAISPGQYVNSPAGTNSAIDLRGVGLQRTLVLVDGRRLPSLPSRGAGLEQSDLNAIPLGAIERLEILTATAGGIHGPTAIGGVVNVVLKRDYRGADLTVVSGLSGRGDAGRGRLEARIGFTPDAGRTDVMLAASYAAAQRLTVGQRDYARRSLEWQARNNPGEFLFQQRPVNAITVRSSQGESLRLDAAYGGAALSSSYTFLPLGFQGTDQEKAAVLVANAGRLPTSSPAGTAGDDTSLISTPKTYSILFSARHRLSDRIEIFADGLDLHDEARTVTPKSPGFRSESHANAAGNLFANTVYFNFPLQDLVETRTTTVDVRRFTGGMIATLPGRWRGSADYTVGRSVLTAESQSTVLSGFGSALWDGFAGARGQPPVMPLGDYSALQSAAMAYASPSGGRSRLTTQFSSGVVRAAGPLIDLPGGPLTATLLGEVRRERMPQSDYVFTSTGVTFQSPTPDRVQRVTSGYAELRAPLLGRDASITPLRGLELQLAVRRDAIKTTFPDTVLTGVANVMTRTFARHEADVFTLGARAYPADWLMLRASAATGESPPDLTHLQQLGIVASNAAVFPTTDPKRGDRPIVADGPFLWGRTGWHDIGQEKGLTRSLGVVLNPSGAKGPRLSIDVSRLEIRDEIGASGIDYNDMLAHEERYPTASFANRCPRPTQPLAIPPAASWRCMAGWETSDGPSPKPWTFSWSGRPRRSSGARRWSTAPRPGNPPCAPGADPARPGWTGSATATAPLNGGEMAAPNGGAAR